MLYGQSPDNLSESADINDASTTSYTVQGLASGTWYFAVVSVDSEGDESPPTNILSASI